MTSHSDYPFSIDAGDPAPRYHIVLRPFAQEPESELVQALSKILDLDLYMTRQILLSSAPRILSSFVNTHQAQPECDALCELGLEALVAHHDLLFGGEPILITRRIDIDETGIGFFSKRYDQRDFSKNDIDFIVKGRRIYRADESEKKSKRATADTRVQDFGFTRSRFSMDSSVKVAQQRFDSEIEYFLLAFAGSPVPVAELGQNDLNYDFLGEEKKSTTTDNFNEMCQRLQSALPNAQWDDTLCHGILLETRTNELNYRLARLFERPVEELTARLYFMTRSGWKPA